MPLPLEAWKKRIDELRTETYAIYLASKDSRVPWYVKALILFVVVHTFSPIDLIPDFIPILGYLDDLIIAPLGIALAIRLIPEEVLAESRERARSIRGEDGPSRRLMAAIVVAIWFVTAALAAVVVWRFAGS